MKVYWASFAAPSATDVLADFLRELRVGLPRPVLVELADHALARSGYQQDLLGRGGVEVDVDERLLVEGHRLLLRELLPEQVTR